MDTQQTNIQNYKFTYMDKDTGRKTSDVYFDGKEWKIKGPGMEYEFIEHLKYQIIYYPANINDTLDYIQKTSDKAQEQFNLLSQWIMDINRCRPEGLI